MLEDRRKLWQLRRRVNTAKDNVVSAQSRFKLGQIDRESLWALQKELRSREQSLQRSESRFLTKEAQRKGIEIPRKPGWWDDDSEEFSRGGMSQREIEEVMSEWLTLTGIFGTRKLFKEECRKNFEWWYTKVVIPTLQVSVPITALFLVYLSSRK